MSFTSKGKTVAFPFRVGPIQKIFADSLDREESVSDKVFSRYDASTGAYLDKKGDVLDVDNTLIKNLKEYGSNQGINDSIRLMTTGISASILETAKATQVSTAPDGIFTTQFKTTVSDNTKTYSLPDEMVKTFENPDDFVLSDSKGIAFRKNIIDQVALQGAELIQHMFRLSAKFLQNNMAQKIMYRTNQGYDEMGLYRIVLYCDMSDTRFDKYYDQFKKYFNVRNVAEIASGDKMIPFVFLLMVFRSPDSKTSQLTNLYIKFQQDLQFEYNQYIEPLMRQAQNTDSFPFNPENVPPNFWTLQYADQGIEDLAARVVIRSYPDFFPPLDTNTLEAIWKCDKNMVPCFQFERVVAAIGQDMLEIIARNEPSYKTNWQNITDFAVREAMTRSPYSFCNMLAPKDCAYPLPLFVRNLFNSNVNHSKNTLMSHTKDVVTYFVFSANAALRSANKRLAESVFSKEPTKEKFPANDQITAIVYHVVIAYCLYLEKDNIKWTNPRYESQSHPSPWQVLIERCNDVNSPNTAISNYTGLRRFIQHLDVLLFSFVGGYIMQANDQVSATHFRKIRVALLRMGFLDTRDLGLEYQNFVKDANAPGLIHRFEDAFTNYNMIRSSVDTMSLVNSGYTPNKQPNFQDPQFNKPTYIDDIADQQRTISRGSNVGGRGINSQQNWIVPVDPADWTRKIKALKDLIAVKRKQYAGLRTKDNYSIDQIFQQLETTIPRLEFFNGTQDTTGMRNYLLTVLTKYADMDWPNTSRKKTRLESDTLPIHFADNDQLPEDINGYISRFDQYRDSIYAFSPFMHEDEFDGIMDQDTLKKINDQLSDPPQSDLEFAYKSAVSNILTRTEKLDEEKQSLILKLLLQQVEDTNYIDENKLNGLKPIATVAFAFDPRAVMPTLEQVMQPLEATALE
jgi:hypothetical protein